MTMDSQLFNQFMEDHWSADSYESKPINNTGSDLCSDYRWLDQYNPLAFNFEDLQGLGDLDSYNLPTSTSPLDFALPSPISEVSPLSTEDTRLNNQKSFINPWLIPTPFESSASPLSGSRTSHSPSPSPPSLASSPGSSSSSAETTSPREDTERKPSSKSRATTMPMRTTTRKARTQQTSSESSRSSKAVSASNSSASASPIGKRQNNSHNLIEKRYRNNLNSKINALRDRIPSLSSSSISTAKSEDGCDDAMDSDSGERERERGGRAPKCNKGTILDKAIQYIADLEQQVQRLEKEKESLQTVVAHASSAMSNIPDYLMLGGMNKTTAAPYS